MHVGARKIERQNVIVELIRNQQIGTQTELRDALRERGVECDQGTVSRDVRELGLVKAASDDGTYHYALIADVSPSVRVSRMTVLRQMVRSAVVSGNLIVIKCGSGNASAVAEALDHLNLDDIVGTVAGDNTLFAVVAEGVDAKRTADKFMKEIGLK